MQTTQALLCCAAVLLLGGYVGSSSSAQGIPNAVPAPRYQISAWAFAGHPSRVAPERGCYILDTVTGELWHSGADGKPVKISEKL
jgi:esterase/lipase